MNAHLLALGDSRRVRFLPDGDPGLPAVVLDEPYLRDAWMRGVPEGFHPAGDAHLLAVDVLEELVDAPDSFTLRTEAEAEKLHADATWLIDQLRPFAPDGQFAHLGRHSEVDFAAEDLIYLDLAQQEGRVGGRTSLVMQLLISLVYERAKQTDREVVFVIDEARYVLRDAENLAFLETIFRLHRHHDLSIQLVTQTVDEFFERSEAEMVLDQCAIKQFHRLDGMDDHWATEFGLNDAQKRFVQEAVPGNEELGYAEALVGVDGEWRGIEVRALEAEKKVIEGNAQSDIS